MKIKEIRVKSILGKSWIGDYCINPYIGCQHACVYCYADYYTKRFLKEDEKWGNYVYVKINAQEVLLKEIVKRRKGTVYLSSLTDPYQPLEAKYAITRKILEILLRYSWPVVIQTKSSLVLRDLDLLKKFKNLTVGLTIVSLSEIYRKFEKFASPPEDRVETLKILKENGIKTFVFIGPIIPFSDFKEIENIVKKTKDFAEEFYFDKLNLKPGLLEKLKSVEGYENLSEEEMQNYYKDIKKKIAALINKNSLKAKILF